MRWKFKAAIVLYVISSPFWGPQAEAAFHLERADQDAPQGIVAHVPIDVTDWGIRPLPAKPVVKTAPAPVSHSRSAMGPMTSRFVRSGCEAAHAQEWDHATGKTYWGKYQYNRGSWIDDGGDPSTYGNAPESEQDRVAARATFDRWPNC